MLDKKTSKQVGYMVNSAENNYKSSVFGFVDPTARADIENIIKKSSVYYDFFGGYDSAERTLLFIGSEEINAQVFGEHIVCLKIISNTQISHPQILGTLIASGISREDIGDILIFAPEKSAYTSYVFCTADSADIVASITKIGNNSVKISKTRLDALNSESDDLSPDGKLKKVSLNSLRLDAFVANAFNLSRAKSASLVQAEKVRINWQPCSNKGKIIELGDIISVEKHGRVKFVDILGNSKKGRDIALIEVFSR